MNMKRIFSIILISVILVDGCSYFRRKPERMEMSVPALKILITQAINGNAKTDSSLSNLINLSLPVNGNYNNLEVGNIFTPSGKKYFTVLLAYPNPIYNRLAIYDSDLNLLLLDKSLNGYISQSIIKLKTREYLKVVEDFKSRNIFELNRVSLYQVTDSSVFLVFRDYTKLISPKNIFTQLISKISSDRILTDITSSKQSPILSKSDAFNYNYLERKFASTQNIFSNFVVDQIRSFKDTSGIQEITDFKSELESVGIDTGIDTLKTTANTISKDGFSLTLTDNWRTLKNIAITSFLKKEVKGTRYINETIGASISVIMIPVEDSTEMFVNYNLDKITAGKYRVRYSGKIELKKDFVQFFEYSCGTKKYLLILQASKYTYNEYKDVFQNIINSFAIEC